MSRNCSECGHHLLKAAARWSGHHRTHSCITELRITQCPESEGSYARVARSMVSTNQR